jgi:hypothetical protein
MKRDWDVIRWLLSKAEEVPGGYPLVFARDGIIYGKPHSSIQIEADRLGDVFEHALLLKDIGFAEVTEIPLSDGLGGVIIHRLKSAGHDFLEAARNDTAWNKTKKTAGEVGGVTLTVFRDLLFGYVKAELQKVTGIDLG